MNDSSAIGFFIFSLILALFALWLTLPSTKGMIGEYFVKKQLEKLAKKYQGLSFHNLMLGTGEQSTQLDNLLITSKAVYVIEVKNYAGRVYGCQYQDQWYQTIRYDNKKRGRGGRIYTKTHIAKNAFFNPIKQNQIHVNAIKQSIQSVESLPIFNVIVFMNRTNITNVEMKDETSYVVNRRHLSRFIKQKEKELNTQAVDLATIQDEFIKKNTFSKENLKRHIRKIKQKYYKS
jgi:hypothetical protein